MEHKALIQMQRVTGQDEYSVQIREKIANEQNIVCYFADSDSEFGEVCITWVLNTGHIQIVRFASYVFQVFPVYQVGRGSRMRETRVSINCLWTAAFHPKPARPLRSASES
jgi:hypothetical protein